MKTNLHLGCGYRQRQSTPEEKWINIDVAPEVKPDIVCDIGHQPLPLPDNSVDHVLSVHSFEHFDNHLDVLKELYRVCKHGATIGPVDEEQLFYLRSRGLTEQEAMTMIVKGLFPRYLENELMQLNRVEWWSSKTASITRLRWLSAGEGAASAPSA